MPSEKRVARHVDAVLFDLDDTLIDWSQSNGGMGKAMRPCLDNVYDYLQLADHRLPERPAFYEAYRETIIAAWTEAKKTWTAVNFGQTFRQVLADLDLDTRQIDIDEVLQVFDWQPVPDVILYDDTIPVLDTIRGRGYKIGLVTNSMMPMWMRDVELRAYGLIDYFDARITSGDTGFMKPHPAIFWRALGLLNTVPDRAVFVGDRPANDVAGANETGLTSVWMNPPHVDLPLDGVVPDFTISGLTQLLPILEQLEGGLHGLNARHRESKTRQQDR